MNIKKSILCIQTAEASYDESFLIFRMQDQLGDKFNIHCLLNSVSSSFVASETAFICGLLNENIDENKKKFDDLIDKIEYEYIVILDLHKTQIHPWDINFYPEWLNDFQNPILAFDYFNLLTYEKDQCQLTKAMVPHEKAHEIKISPFIIKPSPPIQEREKDNRFYYWNVVNSQQKFSQSMVKQQVIDTMELTADTKIISIIIDPLLFQKSLEALLVSYFFILQEVLIYYLRQFKEQKFHVFLCGVGPPETVKRERYKTENFQMHFFNHMTYDIYQTMMCSADLILTNSNMMFPLIDAMGLDTPLAVLGNSIGYQKKGEKEKELMSVFKPAPPLYDLVKIMEEMNKYSFKLPVFPFINYPLREVAFPDTGQQHHVLPHYLFDFFDDIDTEPYIKGLLFDSQDQFKYHNYAKGTLNLNKDSIYINHILEKIEKKEPQWKTTS